MSAALYILVGKGRLLQKRTVRLNMFDMLSLSCSKTVMYLANNIDGLILSGLMSLSEFGVYRLAKQAVEMSNAGLAIVSPKYGGLFRAGVVAKDWDRLRLLVENARKEIFYISGVLLLVLWIIIIGNLIFDLLVLPAVFYIAVVSLSLVPIANGIFGPVSIFVTMLSRESVIIKSNALRIVTVLLVGLFGSVNVVIFAFGCIFFISRFYLFRQQDKALMCH